jgi:uncharacterized membrane protein YbhN (UPF0104 family)
MVKPLRVLLVVAVVGLLGLLSGIIPPPAAFGMIEIAFLGLLVLGVIAAVRTTRD